MGQASSWLLRSGCTVSGTCAGKILSQLLHPQSSHPTPKVIHHRQRILLSPDVWAGQAAQLALQQQHWWQEAMEAALRTPRFFGTTTRFLENPSSRFAQSMQNCFAPCVVFPRFVGQKAQTRRMGLPNFHNYIIVSNHIVPSISKHKFK